MEAATGIDIDHISKTFTPGSAAALVVNDVSVRVDPGELFFLLGPSGCGKTTLLRIIAGFIEPSAGKIWFQQGSTRQDMTATAPENRNTGMVFQSYALWPHMTVEENIGFGLDVRKIVGKEKKERVRGALEAVKMESFASRRPTQLSGGQQQRIALARAIVVRPAVLLLDEPLSNLDAKLRIELRSEIRRVCKLFQMTTVYVTHDQKEALSMADRIAILNRGRVEQVGSPQELYTSPRTSFVAAFLGETNFLEAKVLDGGRLELASGLIDAANVKEQVGGKVVISLRPEAIRFTDDGAAGIAGVIEDSVYLGDAAHYVVRLSDRERVTVSIANPGAAPRSRGEQVRIVVAPRDVVVVEPSEG